jgi:hypothetical protein
VSKRPARSAGLPVINEYAAAIDIGARFHVATVAPDLCEQPVQTFQAFTGDTERMAELTSRIPNRRYQNPALKRDNLMQLALTSGHYYISLQVLISRKFTALDHTWP